MTKDEFDARILQLPVHQIESYEVTAEHLVEDVLFYTKRVITMLVGWLLLSIILAVIGFMESLTYGMLALIFASVSAHFGKNYIVKMALIMSMLHMINAIIMLRGFGFNDTEIQSSLQHVIPFQPKQSEQRAAAQQTAFQYLS